MPNNRLVLALLAVALFFSAAYARTPPGINDVAAVAAPTISSAGRRLLVDKCDGYCAQCNNLGTGGGRTCKACQGNLVLLKNLPVGHDLFMTCGCPAGTYLTGTGGGASCVTCPKGSWCGGLRDDKTACPDHMTTAGLKAKKSTACLENPGYKYIPPASAGAAPSAEFCPDNTYSPGLKKLLACRKCAAGFVIQDNAAARTSPDVCVAPPGWYVNQAGVAAKCPKGEYKGGYNLNTKCTKCVAGVTTNAPGQASVAECKVLLPGFTGAMSDPASGGMDAATVKPCPQKYYCPGVAVPSADNPAAIACPSGLWTRGMGAKSTDACLMPPGYGYNLNTNTFVKCTSGSYRPNWNPLPEVVDDALCIPCGTDIASDTTQMSLEVFDADGGVTYDTVAGSAEACYIEPGYAMYKDLMSGYRAVPCSADDVYGAPTRLYGLSPSPCRQCPGNMKTTDANADFKTGAGLAINPLACLTQPGYGLQSRISEQCAVGTYNEGGNRDPCTECGAGRTTADVGSDSGADCIIAPGYEVDPVLADGSTRECRKGYYNTGGNNACTACDNGFTTETTGATSGALCELCQGGYGGANCAVCGSGYYAPADNPKQDCVACPAGTDFMMANTGISEENMVYTAPSISIPGSSSKGDCLAAYTQLSNGAVLSATAGLTEAAGVGTLADCITACGDILCQWLNFDYATSTCYLRTTGGIGVNADTGKAYLVGLKIASAGNVGAETTPSANSFGSGMYSTYEDKSANTISDLVQVTGLNGAQCLEHCTEDAGCAGIRLTLAQSDFEADSCYLIKPAPPTSGLVRSLMRSVPSL